MNIYNTYIKCEGPDGPEYQSVSDLLNVGALIDPETGDDLELADGNLYRKHRDHFVKIEC